MKENRNSHLRVQEFCDCYATTDPLREMSRVSSDKDTDEAALKWVALAALHGVNDNARKIVLTRAADGGITVSADYRESELPTPGGAVGSKVIHALRDITHIEGKQGTLPLSLGIRDSSVTVTVGVDERNGGEAVTLEFPG